MGRGNINQRLNGLNPLSYMGDNAYQPPEFVTDNRAPTANDSMNFELGTIWLDTVTVVPPTANNIWMLVALRGGVATWVNFSAGVMTLTSNSGGPVSPTAGNINVVGDGTTIVGVGVPGTHTITFSTSGTGVVSSLTGNSGGAVFPTAGNINVLGTGVITVVGTPGTSTLTITPSGSIASSFITNPATGTATPAAGVLTFAGAGGVVVSAAGSTVTITGGAGTVNTLHTQDGNNVTATGGVINVSGAHGLNTTGTVGPNTVTVAINNTITLGDLTPIIGSPAITLTTGDATITAGNINLTNTNTAGTIGVVKYSGTRWINNYGISNVFIGNNSGNLALTVLNAAQNIGIGSSTFAAITTGADNICIGTIAGQLLTTGGRNTVLGSGALQTATTGGSNTAIGPTCLQFLTTGSFNVGIGDDALRLLTTGSSNISIGKIAGTNYTGAETNNINIGDAGISANLAGTLGESNVTRIANIRGTTTTVNDAIAVLIDSTGQLGTVSSSLRYKENIADIGSYSDAIFSLRPVVFNYKNHSPESKSYGLIAEEVEQVMPQLVVYNEEGKPETVKYQDLVPMLLNEIQKLEKRIEMLENR